MRKILIGFGVFLLICAAALLHFHHATPLGEIAYAGNRQSTVWNTTAQVRIPVTTIHFGDRLEILKRSGDDVQVRTADGVTGWINQRELLSNELWQKSKDMDARAASRPVEAHGRTRALANLHIEPGRDSARLRQLDKNVPVDLIERTVVEVPQSSTAGGEEAAGAPVQAKKEDWWLVRAHAVDQSNLSGWILGRFIDLDVPQPLPDYASSTGMRIVAWFELNRVTDPSGNPKPQYLVLGAKGPEGQPCDFTLLRAYTWGLQRQRYETAFVESDLCGKLPVKLTQSKGPGGDVTFSFQDSSKGAPEDRAYRMHQTIVRRVRDDGASARKPRKTAR